MKNFNFFKVNQAIITNNVGDYVKNSIEANKDCLEILEQEFKNDLYKGV